MKNTKHIATALLTLGVLLSSHGVSATVFTDDFSGDLSNWTAGPSHLDSYGIVGGELYMDGYGHLSNPSNGGWGVLQFNEQLGSSFVATWDAKISYYDYSNFVLFADTPWDFNSGYGYANNGYVGWVDINDPFNPLMDVQKMSGGTASDLTTPQRDIAVSPDIANNQWFTWKVEVMEGALKVFIDDTLYVDTFDSQYASSDFKLGLSFGEDSRGYIDNFQVTTFNVPEPSTLFLLGFGCLGVALARKRAI